MRTRLSGYSPRVWWVTPAVVLIVSVAVTAGVYGTTLGYSFFMDDVLDTTWTEQRSYWEIFTERFPGFGYYRPVPFLIFKASFDALGAHNTIVLRTILVTTHILSSLLVYLLLRRLTESEWSVAASVLFLMFPFSYQNISVIGAMGHVLVTMLLLGTLLLWWEGRTRNVPWLLVASVATAIVAVWTIEYGVLALPLVIGMELLVHWRTGESVFTLTGLPYFLMLAAAHLVYFILWFGLDRPESEPVTAGDIARNVAFWLQAVAYPLTRFLNILMDEPMGYRAVVLISVLIILSAIIAHAILKQMTLAAIALVAAFVCFMPSMLMLTHEYVLSGPRLLYVASPAIAAFWAMLGRALFAERWHARVWQAGVLMFIAITILQSHSFIERRLEMFQAANEVVNAVVDVAGSQRDKPVLIMNAPAWFSFHSLADQEYPIGHLGVQAIPPHVGFDGLTYAVTGERAEVESGALAPSVSGWTYSWSPHGPLMDHDEVNERLQAGYKLYVVRLTPEGPRLDSAGEIRSGDADDEEVLATFGDGIQLSSIDLDAGRNLLLIETEWRVTGPLAGDYQLSYKIRDRSGQVIVDHRDYALSGMSPPRLWQAGDTISDFLVLDLPYQLDIDSLGIGFINTADESMLEITDAEIELQDENQVVITP
jgi:hypothetical protein